MASDPQPDLLTDGQRRLVGFALSFIAFLAVAAGFIGAFYVLGQLVGYFSGVLWPIAVAGVIAVVLRPLVDRIRVRLRLSRLMSVILLYVVFVLLAAGFLTWLVPLLVGQLLDFIAYLPQLGDDLRKFFVERHPTWANFIQEQLASPTVQRLLNNLESEIQALASGILPSLRAAGGGMVGVFGTVTHIVVVPVYLFFFLLSKGEPAEHLPEHLHFLRSGVRGDIVFLVREFIAIIETFFRGQLIIGLIMGSLFGIGFSIIGLKFGLFIGLALGLLNVIPYLGTTLGLAVALPLAFFQTGGGWNLVGLVLLVEVLVQTTEGWFLTPKIMGNRTGLHPVMIIFALFFWGTVFSGVIGMLLAIPLTAFFVTAWRLARRKYLPTRESRPPLP